MKFKSNLPDNGFLGELFSFYCCFICAGFIKIKLGWNNTSKPSLNHVYLITFVSHQADIINTQCIYITLKTFYKNLIKFQQFYKPKYIHNIVSNTVV